MSGFKNFYLAENPDERCSMSFIATTLMDRNKGISTTSSNNGGWAETDLNSYMNTRMYNALDPIWKQLIKKVSVPSSNGNKSTGISYSSCYLYIPSVIELDSTKTTDPYIGEGSSTPYIVTKSDRIRMHDNGSVEEYWTRSPNASQTSYFHTIGQDGDVKGGFMSLTSEMGILLELSI